MRRIVVCVSQTGGSSAGSALGSGVSGKERAAGDCCLFSGVIGPSSVVVVVAPHVATCDGAIPANALSHCGTHVFAGRAGRSSKGCSRTRESCTRALLRRSGPRPETGVTQTDARPPSATCLWPQSLVCIVGAHSLLRRHGFGGPRRRSQLSCLRRHHQGCRPTKRPQCAPQCFSTCNVQPRQHGLNTPTGMCRASQARCIV